MKISTINVIPPTIPTSKRGIKCLVDNSIYQNSAKISENNNNLVNAKRKY